MDALPKDIFFRCVEDSSEAIMISDREGRLIYVNPSWQETYRVLPPGGDRKKPSLLHSGLHSKEFYSAMWRGIADPKIGYWKGELVNRSKGGSLIPVLLTITPVFTETGEVSAYMGIAVDIRFKRELEAKVAHQDRLASIGLLSSGIAHEIGTPLGVIRGRAEMIRSEALSPMAQKSVEVILGQIDRVSRLIQSLLGVGRNFGELRIEALDPEPLIQDLFTLIGQHLRALRVEVKCQVQPGTRLAADRSRLQHILLNLIVNSTQAIQKAISGGRTSGHELVIEASRGEITVSDTGCGIAPGHLKEIFKPFFTTKDVGEGTGLGLSIVRQLADEIEGRIEVESILDVGTRFRLSLSRSLPETPRSPGSQAR